MAPEDTWSDYEKLVLSELKRLGKEISTVRREFKEETRLFRQDVKESVEEVEAVVGSNKASIIKLKANSAITAIVAGALAGGGPALVAFLIWLISR